MSVTKKLTNGEKLRFFRDQVKKKQIEIFNETGIPQTTLSGWELDKSKPDIDELLLLLPSLKVTIEEFTKDKTV